MEGAGRDRRSDSELLKRSRKDPNAFRVFYRRHSRFIDGWIRGQVHDREAAAELTAETFARAWVGLDRFKPDSDDAGKRWLFGIARNLTREYFRKQRIDRSAREQIGMQPAAPTEDIQDQVSGRLANSEFAALIDRLPQHERDALRLRVFADLSYAEVATRLDCTSVAARIRVSRALQRMRSELGAGERRDLQGPIDGGVANEQRI